METSLLRELVSEAAKRFGGTIWPNGLGFDYRRWTLSYSEYYGEWVAYLTDDNVTPAGHGQSAEVALERARQLRRKAS